VSTSNDHSGFAHGALTLPDVTITSYNLELRDDEGFVGDRASGRAFRAILDELRAKVGEVADDPFGAVPSRDLKKKTLDKMLAEGDPIAAGIIHGAIEEFAGALAAVVRRFLRLKAWSTVTRVVVGGGLRHSRIGELAIGRADVILKAERIAVDLVPLTRHPDHAGLIGCTRIMPSWLLEGFDAMLAVDVGGTNIRCGVVRLNTDKAADLSAAEIGQFELWTHADDKPGREQAIDRLADMLRDLQAKVEKKDMRLAPLIGVGCPGLIDPDGSIERGAQNLPGNWSSQRFNLPAALSRRIPAIGDHDTVVVMHNDAVVQGLSEVPTMNEAGDWGVLTIGTGLGNASFSNRTAEEPPRKQARAKPKAKPRKK
jgi:predicted NBD/HSP70 family sugar kinase